MSLGAPWLTKPDAINEIGVRFWLDKSSTEYAISKGFKDVQVLYVERPDGYRTRLIVQAGKEVYDSQQLEAIGAHLDIMAMDRDFPR